VDYRKEYLEDLDKRIRCLSRVLRESRNDSDSVWFLEAQAQVRVLMKRRRVLVEMMRESRDV